MAKKKTNYWLLGIGVASAIIAIFVFIGLIGYAFSEFSLTSQVAHITISGPIMTQGSTDLFGSPTSASSEKVVEKIQSISESGNYDAIIFQINSPGGSGVASDEIATAIKDADIPTVAYIREVGASGAYWIASATDHIIANRMSTVGSIGVIASYLEFSGLLDDYNVTYQRFVAGENKDFGVPFREPTESERAQFQELLDEMHELFISEVAQNRKMDVQQIRNLADGSIYSGSQAYRNGLVDQIGGREQAIAYIETRLETEVTVVDLVDEPSFLDALAGYFKPTSLFFQRQTPIIFT